MEATMTWAACVIAKHRQTHSYLDIYLSTYWSLYFCFPDDSSTTTVLTPVSFPPVLTPSVPVLLPSSHEGVVLAGFQDCSHEAIRYLIDVEKIAQDDPLIVGLQQHLRQHQQQMDLAQTFSECLQSMDSEDMSDSHSERTDLKHIPQSHYELSSMDMTDSHSEADSLEDRLTGDCNTGSDNENMNEQMTDSVLDLALLAQNNPAIASLTEEILGLLEEEQMGSQPVTDNVPPNES